MAHDSRRKKHLRRVKRERSLAFRLLGHVQGERDHLRDMLMKLTRPIVASTTPKEADAEKSA